MIQPLPLRLRKKKEQKKKERKKFFTKRDEPVWFWYLKRYHLAWLTYMHRHMVSCIGDMIKGDEYDVAMIDSSCVIG